jgi:hypothetical protein
MLLRVLLTILVLVATAPTASELDDRFAYWNKSAFLCQASDGTLFPSKPTSGDAQPCDDGDMTLFNGLLCAAGDQRRPRRCECSRPRHRTMAPLPTNKAERKRSWGAHSHLIWHWACSFISLNR